MDAISGGEFHVNGYENYNIQNITFSNLEIDMKYHEIKNSF